MNKRVLCSLILAMMATMWAGVAQAQTKYDFKIAGVTVTSDNCGDLSVIDGVTGTVKYDDATKTLTLENANIRCKAEGISGSGIYTSSKELNIRLVGNNTIASENGVGIWNERDGVITFTGNGKLIVNGSTTAAVSNYRKGIFSKGTITVSNCTLEVVAGEYGLCGGYWKFDHCVVRAKGDGSSDDEYAGSIGWIWEEPEFVGCAVISPAGEYWKEFQKGENAYFSLFDVDNKIVTDWVVIADPTAGIKAVKPDMAEKKCGNYTLQGVRLSDNFESLPTGVYIVNGKKVMKK